MPALLDDDNQVVAVGCGAMEPNKVRRPPGLLLWPLMAFSARYVEKSTRRHLLEQVKAERGMANSGPPATPCGRRGADSAAAED
jgi:hypothetical protein